MKKVVERLEGENREEHRTHRKVYRPWGNYDPVHGGDGFKIKHIVVHPGQRLSLQAHRHRAEHWVVVRGEARVTRDGETFTLLANQSTFIPKGVKHRLENPGTAQLEIIEVQTGKLPRGGRHRALRGCLRPSPIRVPRRVGLRFSATVGVTRLRAVVGMARFPPFHRRVPHCPDVRPGECRLSGQPANSHRLSSRGRQDAAVTRRTDRKSAFALLKA